MQNGVKTNRFRLLMRQPNEALEVHKQPLYSFLPSCRYLESDFNPIIKNCSRLSAANNTNSFQFLAIPCNEPKLFRLRIICLQFVLSAKRSEYLSDKMIIGYHGYRVGFSVELALMLTISTQTRVGRPTHLVNHKKPKKQKI